MSRPQPGEPAGSIPSKPPFDRASNGRRALRLWGPVAVTLAVQVPPTLAALVVPQLRPRAGAGSGRFPFSFAPEQALALVALAVLAAATLLAARRAPGPVVAVVSVLAATDALVSAGDRFWPPFVALAFAIVSAVVRGARLWAWISVAVAGAAALVIGPLLGVQWAGGQVAAPAFAVLATFGAGEFVRTRRERAAAAVAARRVAERDALQAERVRIARELHDVLAHSLSQISLQAGVGLHLGERDPDKAREALASVRDTAKTALEEVRHVLGVLRSDDADAPLVPEPDLSRLEDLAASVRRPGLEVGLRNELTGDVPRAVQLALFRIVQESLTNVARHADATRVDVALAADEGAYRVRVVDDGSSGAAGPAGRGILGMRERAALLGGSLTAAPRPDGGFAVEARIPTTEGAAR